MTRGINKAFEPVEDNARYNERGGEKLEPLRRGEQDRPISIGSASVNGQTVRLFTMNGEKGYFDPQNPQNWIRVPESNMQLDNADEGWYLVWDDDPEE